MIGNQKKLGSFVHESSEMATELSFVRRNVPLGNTPCDDGGFPELLRETWGGGLASSTIQLARYPPWPLSNHFFATFSGGTSKCQATPWASSTPPKVALYVVQASLQRGTLTGVRSIPLYIISEADFVPWNMAQCLPPGNS